MKAKKTYGICSGCEKERLIVYKKGNLCQYCNRSRWPLRSARPKRTRIKRKPVKDKSSKVYEIYDGRRMQRYEAVYRRKMGYDGYEPLVCEVSGEPTGEIHHISPRGMGGDPEGKKDVIENLMAVTREIHERCEGTRLPRIKKDEQIRIHTQFLKSRDVIITHNR